MPLDEAMTLAASLATVPAWWSLRVGAPGSDPAQLVAAALERELLSR